MAMAVATLPPPSHAEAGPSQAEGECSSHRPTAAIPPPLLENIRVQLEELLFPLAFSALTALIPSGHASDHPVPCRLPPPPVLALAATLSLHPSLTSRTADAEKHEAANAALAYLRSLIKGVCVAESGLDRACTFSAARRQSAARARRGGKRGAIGAELADEDGEGEYVLRVRSKRIEYTGIAALWTHAEDFWHLLGWALNCSILHPPRWARYLPFLDWMLDLLSSDLTAHASRGQAQQSMLAHYLGGVGEGRNKKRRVMRAILADGSSRSLGEFGELWRNETLPPKRKEEDAAARSSKKRKLDLDAGHFGDYDDSDSDMDSLAPASLPRSRSASAMTATKTNLQPFGDEADTPSASSTASDLQAFGGVESIKIRKRMLALLVRLSQVSPPTFLDTEDTFDLFTEFLRPLPLPAFQQIVFTGFSSDAWLGVNEQSSLDQMLCRPLLASAAPAYNDNALTQSDFETHYAPYPANTTSAGDNAKVTLLLEDLLRLLWRAGGLISSEALRDGVERGIKARKEKVAFDGRKKKGQRIKDDEDAVAVMECSAQRMLTVLEMVRE